jgi:hypothetical protein
LASNFNNIRKNPHLFHFISFQSHSFNLLKEVFCVPHFSMPSKSQPPARSWASTLTVLAAVVGVLSAVFYFLDSHLDWFYILNVNDLNDLSQRAIGAHGNDTRSVVTFIASELSEKFPGGHINLDEEWIFNNAGGAMGAMWILHASESSPFSSCSHRVKSMSISRDQPPEPPY